MKITAAGLCAALLIPAGLLASDDNTAEIEQAKKATAAFGGALKSELVKAMQSGGAIGAIDVCHTRADEIAETLSKETGMNVSRISAKNRNPGNAANGEQLKVLQSFDERSKSGEAPASLSWTETIENENGAEFRFMKAIPTAGLCLQCHGTAIDPEVSDRLNELYPNDKATGYSEGDIRGAFLVTRQLD
jgi:hypothetical protein